MPWSGVAAVEMIGHGHVRYTGIAVPALGQATISLASGLGDLKLPVDFDIANLQGNTLTAVLEVSFYPAGPLTKPLLLSMVKTASPAFLVTFSNGDKVATPPLEVYIKRHWIMCGWQAG